MKTMIRVVAAAMFVAGLGVASASGQTPATEPAEVLPLWPKGLPEGSVAMDPAEVARLKASEDAEHIRVVELPELFVFPAPADTATGTSVLILPGGGYNVLAWKKEGTEIAAWFQSIGVTAFVLKYRVPRRDANQFHREPLQDAQRALRIIRDRAATWKIDPQRVGVLGFSAGGHLAVMTGMTGTRTYPAVDAADEGSVRPAFICPIYGAYLGNHYRDDVVELGDWLQVTPDFPPTFQAVTADDNKRGAQAALLFARLVEQGVPAELHVWAAGGHGYGLRPGPEPVRQWPGQLREWMHHSGWLEPRGERP